MKICMAGACGRMGRRILELAAATGDIEIGGAFDLAAFAGTRLHLPGNTDPVIVSSDGVGELAKSDVLIDFTAPEASVANVWIAAQTDKPSVVGTTGLSETQKADLTVAARRIPVVFAPNMSVGVNLLFRLAGDVARILGLDYNVEIIEVHHNQKKDSPSGTAIRLAECVAEALGLDPGGDVIHGRQAAVGKRPQRQIGMHAVRGGDVVGEHTVGFYGPGERLELTHKAHTRDNFARGALIAARFAVKAGPGLYDMQDVLGLR